MVEPQPRNTVLTVGTAELARAEGAYAALGDALVAAGDLRIDPDGARSLAAARRHFAGTLRDLGRHVAAFQPLTFALYSAAGQLEEKASFTEQSLADLEGHTR